MSQHTVASTGEGSTSSAGGRGPRTDDTNPSRSRALAAHLRTFWPALVGAGIAAATTSFPVRGALPTHDAGVYAYVGWMITRGHMPYVDAWDNKGPLTYLLYAVGTGLDPDHGMFAVAVVNLLVVAVLAYRLALVLVRPAVAGPVVGVALALLVYTPELTETLSLGFLLYPTLVAVRMLVADVAPTKVQAALAGGCLAAASLMRANNALVLVPLGLLACVWLARRSRVTAARMLGWLLVGATAVTTPIALWLWHGGALGACLDAAYTGSLGWELSWTTRIAHTADLIMGYGLAPLVVWLVLLVVTVLGVGRARRPGVRQLGWALLGGLGVFAAANVVGPGMKYPHYLVVLFPLTLLAALVVLTSAYDWLARTGAAPPRRVALLAGAALLLLVPQLDLVADRATKPYDTSRLVSQTRQQLVTYIERSTDPDDKVLMVDFAVFGAQYQRESPTPYYRPSPLWNHPTQERIWQRIAADTTADRPALIVFGTSRERRHLLDALPPDQRADMEALLSEYQRSAPVGDYLVYRRNVPNGR